MSRITLRIGFFLVLVAAASALIPASAAVMPRGAQRPLYVPSRLIVKYREGTGFEQRAAALRAEEAREERALGIPRLSVITLPEGADVMQAARRLEASGVVEYAEPDYYRYPTVTVKSASLCTHTDYTVAPSGCVHPNDPAFPDQWYLENTSIMPDADIGATAAWDLFCNPSGSTCTNSLASPAKVSSFKVAIIDDGFDLSNPDLKANFVAGTDCSGGSCKPTSTTAAQATKTDGSQDHGTYVASTLAAVGNNGKAMTGVLWSAKIVPIKSDLTDSSIVAGIEYAINYGGGGQVQVINESFGGPIPSHAEYDALKDAEDAGILVVVSAGNSDSDNDRAGAAYPANYAAPTVIFPRTDANGNPIVGSTNSRAGLPNVLAVAASTDTDTMTTWSQWGSFNVGLLAPGESIVALQRGGNGATAFVAGTSFSSPITAGTAALVGQYLIENSNPLTPDWHDLKAHLLNGGERSQNNKSAASLDGRSQAGRLNAYLAMQNVTHGVIVVRSATVDDSSGGNNDGEFDPGESPNLVVSVANVGTDETSVTGTLSYAGTDGLITVPAGTDTQTSTGALNATISGHDVTYGTADLSFPIDVASSLSGYHNLLFKLHVTTASGGSADRYFYLEAGHLSNNVTVHGTLTQTFFDDFHDYHVDVPSGAKNLVIYSTTPGGVDIDLIAMKGRLPQYLETLGVDSPSSDPEFQQYIEPDAQTSGRADGDESIAYDGLANPFDAANRPSTSAGTYHVVVVNFSGQSKQPYTLTACYAAPGSNEVTFDGNGEFDEAAGKATLHLLRSGSSGAVSVHYATQDGGTSSANRSAVAGTNYAATSGTVQWSSGQSGAKTITVPLINTGTIATGAANFRHFRVNLSSPTGGLKLGCIKQADVAIGNPATVIPSSGGSSGGGGTPPPSSGKSGGGIFDIVSLLALAAALVRRRR